MKRQRTDLLLLFTNGRHRPVTRTNDCVVRQRENLLEIILHRVRIGNAAAAHRSGKKRIADKRNGMRETGNNEGGAAGRMSPGQTRFDIEFADLKSFSFGKRLCAGADSRSEMKTVAPVFSTKSIKILDVIGMRVREQNEFHASVFSLDPLEHFAAISAGIERDGIARFRIPDEIRVHRHIAIIRVELRQAVEFDGMSASIALRRSRSKQSARALRTGATRQALRHRTCRRAIREFSPPELRDFSASWLSEMPRPRCALPIMSAKLSSSGIILCRPFQRERVRARATFGAGDVAQSSVTDRPRRSPAGAELATSLAPDSFSIEVIVTLAMPQGMI